MFEVIPAIDVAAGRLATYARGGPRPVESFEGDPLAAARAFVGWGARRIHVVDMDLAFGREARNLPVVAAIAELGVRVQGSGGVADLGTARRFLDAGADRVVLGSRAFADEQATVEAIGELGSRLIVGVEVDGGRIRSRGTAPVDLPLVETLGWLTAGGAAGFLVTSVPRVGGLGGPDVATVGRVVRAGRPVLAAGGVATVEHLRSLRRAGAAGAVVGRAAVEGELSLREALELT